MIFKQLAKRYADKKEHKQLLKLVIEMTQHLEADELSADIIGKLNGMAEREKIMDEHKIKYELKVREMIFIWNSQRIDEVNLESIIIDYPTLEDDVFKICFLIKLRNGSQTVYRTENAGTLEGCYKLLYYSLVHRGIGELIFIYKEAEIRRYREEQKFKELEEERAKKAERLAKTLIREEKFKEEEKVRLKMLSYAGLAVYNPQAFATVQQPVPVSKDLYVMSQNLFVKYFFNKNKNQIYHYFLSNERDFDEVLYYNKRDPRITLEEYIRHRNYFLKTQAKDYDIYYHKDGTFDEEAIKRQKELNKAKKRKASQEHFEKLKSGVRGLSFDHYVHRGQRTPPGELASQLTSTRADDPLFGGYTDLASDIYDDL